MFRNLFTRAETKLLLNFEAEFFYLSGVVRPSNEEFIRLRFALFCVCASQLFESFEKLGLSSSELDISSRHRMLKMMCENAKTVEPVDISVLFEVSLQEDAPFCYFEEEIFRDAVQIDSSLKLTNGGHAIISLYRAFFFEFCDFILEADSEFRTHRCVLFLSELTFGRNADRRLDIISDTALAFALSDFIPKFTNFFLKKK